MICARALQYYSAVYRGGGGGGKPERHAFPALDERAPSGAGPTSRGGRPRRVGRFAGDGPIENERAHVTYLYTD